jgi:putative SOS response-associated peptidase YedK
MCGRFEIVDGERVFTRFHISGPYTNLVDNLDVRPTTDIAAIVQDNELQLMTWWLIPSWSKCSMMTLFMILYKSVSRLW